MLSRRHIILGSLLLVFVFYLYIALDSEPIEVEDYNFPPPIENAPLSEREINIRNGTEEAPIRETVVLTYHDGTYDSEAIYLLPNQGQYRLNVSMTIRDEIIVSTIVRINPETQNNEADVFVRNYREQIIGKSIADAELKIEEAPLTSNAFNNTLRDIRQQAYR